MRESNLYGVRVPELGDRADITVVSDAILSNEKDQSGKVENMKATISGNIIALVSEARTNKLKQYYDGLSIQFTSPANIGIGSTHKIKIDNLAERPFTIKTALKVGDIVNATYGQSGFVSSTTPLHNDSAKKETNITAGKGLTGGGDLSANRTIDVVSATDGIVVNENNIQLNVYDGVDSESATRPASANAVKKVNDEKVSKSGDTVDGNLILKKGLAVSLDKLLEFNPSNGVGWAISEKSSDGVLYIYRRTNIEQPYEAYASIDGNGEMYLTKNKYKVYHSGNLNQCPYNVGDMFLTTNTKNPATVWLGTTWQKIEDAVLRATKSGQASKQTGGSDTATLTVENLASHTHSATTASHSHTQPEHKHGARRADRAGTGGEGNVGGSNSPNAFNDTTSAGGETTGSASPVTTIGSTGSGKAFSVLNKYYSVHVWLRIS